jgi:4-aminobutyrate aminotransferase
MAASEVPFIQTEIPGPKARRLLERQEKLLVYTLPTWVPIVWQEGHGAVVTDVDGNRYIDFSSGVSVMNTGHSHPVFVRKLQEQVEKLSHSYFAPTEVQVEAMEALTSILPRALRRVVLTNTGAEGLEMAVKVARAYSGKSELITFHGAFHGRTALDRAMTGIWHVRKGVGPLPAGHIHAPYAYCYRCSFGLERKSCQLQCLRYLEELMITVARGDTAGVVVEPYLGVAGSIVPPPEFLKGLRSFCDRHELLLIFDEVQASFGRTGKMFAFEHYDLLPDIVVLGKGIASGVPTSAVAMGDDIADALRAVGWPSTFAANPLSCAGIVASVEVLVEEKLAERAARTGERIMARLEEIKARWPLVGDVRGIGLSIGVEFVRDRATKEPAREETRQVFEGLTRRGVITLPPGGLYNNIIRITPPLVISEELADKGLDILEESVKEVSQQ